MNNQNDKQRGLGNNDILAILRAADDTTYLKDRNREMILMFLEKVKETGNLIRMIGDD